MSTGRTLTLNLHAWCETLAGVLKLSELGTALRTLGKAVSEEELETLAEGGSTFDLAAFEAMVGKTVS